MVSTPALGDAATQLLQGLGHDDCVRVKAALDFAVASYGERLAATGQGACEFSVGVAVTLALLRSDAETRIAGLLFELCIMEPALAQTIEERFGKEVADMVHGVHQLIRLRDLTATQAPVGRGKNAAQEAMAQIETLRKMLLAMASDMRVVLVRLASCVTTLRHFAEKKRFDEVTSNYGREVLDLYAPLANRLGIFQLKWELEDLAFRMIDPEMYKRIAKMLEEKRMLRESFVASSIERLQAELAAAGIRAEVSGRPKHIYSIWKKMRGKDLDFTELYDVRAFRVIVADVKTCYTVLGVVHNIWTPIPKEFDDYISRPKPNGYQSLHTVVNADDGRPLEVQIRTQEMHGFAEYGVAAHWRYKEEGGSNFKSQQYDEKIAWLRQLLAWKSDVADAVTGQEELQKEWVEKLKATTLDDRIFVLTPQARVLELPVGATPIDFAYHLHSEVGHRCRGAKVDGTMVPLNTALKNGQTCEIITAKGAPGSAGPSRDWLGAGYTVSSRTRTKIRAFFHAQELAETLAHGRALVEKTLQREGKTAVNLDTLAHKLGFTKVDDLFIAVGKDKFSLRHVEAALHEPVEVPELQDADVVNKSRASSVEQGAKSGVLVVGTDGLMTQLARCCKPAPPDPIVGFVTRGKGVSIHRASCKNFAEMAAKAPERVLDTAWGLTGSDTVYPIDIFILAQDRQGLLRDISEVLTREKINVIGVNTQSAKGQARMVFTAEIGSTGQLQKAIAAIGEVTGVLEAKRT
ncbi:bifunctional (p)ppGpp synthetase/guanosine-3',5'-bis(diphosphate) 3'-pyrophosphohydrolase [uncultured Massilia sp.]|uniref:RelA/SpoT family protein n=1 Tax=uncultured Massilia sp. TaxID=169973 RepID=UPI0025D98F3A|nr:bifunctional (p)ppGpp synthetase/guanosine-3',5'-bis(diphosphate) 3'-pyrophosphohydrolase [uncultured Massilia sp.]